LDQEGYTVHGIDIEEPQFELPNSVHTSVVDLTSTEELPESDIIVHLASHSQVQPVVDDPQLALENLEMTQHVLAEADRMDAFVVNASSRDVYGSAIRPKESEVTPDSPNGYAASKIGSEALANAYYHTRGVSVASLRLANVYGPYDRNQRAIPIFIALANVGEELTVYGEGKILDFVHVQDVCDAILATIQRADSASGEVFNIGSGVGNSLPDVASQIATSVDHCPGWTVTEDRTGDVSRYVSNISKSNALLGFDPNRSLAEGLEETIEWYIDYPDLLEEIRSEL
jgi:nucleoside-diphosphate-sugar epimerase